MNKTLSNILRFVILLLVQVLLCNHIHWFGFLNPQVYLMAILLLPLNMKKSFQYIIAFLTGLIVDVFFQTYGLFASATLVLAFLRPLLLYLMNGFRPYESSFNPSPNEHKFASLLTYVFPLVLAHQLVLNMIEIADFTKIIFIIWSSFANAAFTTLIILSLLYIFRRTKE